MTKLRTLLLALAALLAAAASPARAEDGTVTHPVLQGGLGDRRLIRQGRHEFPRRDVRARGRRPLLRLHLRRLADHAAGPRAQHPPGLRCRGRLRRGHAGAAIIKGGQAVILTNQNGAILELSGTQTGLIVSFDLSGLALTVK